MALRKALAYSGKRVRAYTRKSSSKSKAYIKTVPFSKVTKMIMGNTKDYNAGKYKYTVKLVSMDRVQVRDNALESCRMFVNKILEEKMPNQFYLQMKVYPHHMLRENKAATGAGADRLSSGMTQSFGIVIGRAALVNPGQEIIFAACTTEKDARIIRQAMESVKAKVPGRNKILFEKLA